MVFETIGQLRFTLTGGPNGCGDGRGPAVLLCHGFGTSGQDLAWLPNAVRVSREVRWCFPEGPLELDCGWGIVLRGWWGSSPADPSISISAEQAVAGLEDAVRSLETEWGVPPDRLVLGGCSQGAALAAALAMRMKRPVAGLVLMSARLMLRDLWGTDPPGGRGLPVLFCHADNDDVIPISAALELRAELERIGADVAWRTHDGGHKISAKVCDELGAFVRAVLSRAR